MKITISPASEAPIYQQIYDQVSAQIIKGELAGGYCLPPIRTVAKELRISVITVKKAWEELERDGFIDTVMGKGCFVAPMSARALTDKRDQMAAEKLKKDLKFYQKLGLSKVEVLELVEKYYNEGREDN